MTIGLAPTRCDASGPGVDYTLPGPPAATPPAIELHLPAARGRRTGVVQPADLMSTGTTDETARPVGLTGVTR